MQLFNGDCMELFPKLDKCSVDMILCDLPYGFTDAKWDNRLNTYELRKQYMRVLKPDGVIALFANQPFTTELMNTFGSIYSHTWYWKKNNKTGAVFCKTQPLRQIEEIHVFRRSPSHNNEGLFLRTRTYLIEEKRNSGISSKQIAEILGNHMGSHYFTMGKQFAFPSEDAYSRLQKTGFFRLPYEDLKQIYSEERGKALPKHDKCRYYPQGLKKLDNPVVNYAGDHQCELYKINKEKYSIAEYTGYPSNILEYKTDVTRVHPTQKPVPLLEYLIKTYTKPGETVLDNTMGSGSTGVAAVNTGRKFIGMEMDAEYFRVAKNRIESAMK